MYQTNLRKYVWDLKLVEALITRQNALFSSLTVGITQLWSGLKSLVNLDTPHPAPNRGRERLYIV